MSLFDDLPKVIPRTVPSASAKLGWKSKNSSVKGLIFSKIQYFILSCNGELQQDDIIPDKVKIVIKSETSFSRWSTKFFW